MINEFEILGLKRELLVNLSELKFDTMTPIQKEGLPVVLDGKDVLAQAKTGSGKTATFGLGILNSLDVSKLTAQSLVLCPTRELAEQVAKEIRTLARMMKNVRVLTICGGVAQYHQEKSLEHGAHIIVGTPGRVLRLLKAKVLNVDDIKSLVLDEADKMLDMGFNEEIMEVESFLPIERQSMLFSATYPEGIQNLSKDVQRNAIEVKVDVTHNSTTIDQIFYEVKKHQEKNEALLKVLGKYKPERLIVFCKTKRITDDVANFLNDNGIYAEGIHGDLEQSERTSVLTKFTNRSLSVLVATDVAARGLDIQELEAVINYDLPTDPEIYIHRIGRTGRAGLNGQAFSFFHTKERFGLDSIEDLTGKHCVTEDISELSLDNKYDLTPPMSTMFISGGKKSKLRPGDIVGAIVGEAGLDAKDIGDITILNIVSFVAIKNEYINDAISSLNRGKIKNKSFKVGLAY